MGKKKKNIDRTKYGDYSSGALSYEENKAHIFIYTIVSVFVLLFIVYSIANGRIALPKRHGFLYFDGMAMYTVIGALIFMVIGFYLPVIEFYLCRRNFHKRNLIRKRFMRIKKWNRIWAWTLFILSMLIGIFYDQISRV